MVSRSSAVMAAAGFALAAVALFPFSSSVADPVLTEVDVNVELQANSTIRSDETAEELTDSFATVEVAASVQLTTHLRFVSEFTLEPVLDAQPFTDRWFGDHGIYVNALYASLDLGGRVTGQFGKFGPAFGIAWDKAPGVFGTDFAEDYELAEQLGIAFSAELSEVTLEVSAFTLDRSRLARSIVTERELTRRADGGPGNGGALSSFSVAATGNGLGSLRLGWHVGYAYLAEGDGADDAKPAQLWALGAFDTFDMSRDAKLSWLAEAVYGQDLDGISQDLTNVTFGLGFETGNWSLSGVTSARFGSAVDDLLVTGTIGYALPHDWLFETAYRYARVDDTVGHTIGLKLSRSLELR